MAQDCKSSLACCAHELQHCARCNEAAHVQAAQEANAPAMHLPIRHDMQGVKASWFTQGWPQEGMRYAAFYVQAAPRAKARC